MNSNCALSFCIAMTAQRGGGLSHPNATAHFFLFQFPWVAPTETRTRQITTLARAALAGPRAHSIFGGLSLLRGVRPFLSDNMGLYA